MKRFYEDSSQAKILSKSTSIKRALRTLSDNEFFEYELRRYSPDFKEYFVCAVYPTRKAAEVAKAFREIEHRGNFAIVGTYFSKA